MHLVVLNFTDRCNSRCAWCHLWQRTPPRTLSLAAIERLFASDRLAGLRQLYVTGGEPFLTDQVVEIGRLAARYLPGVTFRGETNGLEPDLYLPRMLALKELGLTLDLGVSINGPKQVHDETRGVAGSYEKALRMAELMAEHGIGFQLSCTEGPGADGAHVDELGRRFGVRVWHSPFVRSERYATTGSGQPLKHGWDCAGGTRTIVVWPDGRISACEDDRDHHAPGLTIGDLTREEVEDMRWDEVAAYVASRRCQPCYVACWWGM